ncbi:MAG: DUF1330 domain-containing protein [Phototrophicaceae bacterium]
MALEMLIGVNVIDDGSYQQYREKMTPILHTYGGGFGYDFVVSDVLKNPSANAINRVFTIYFPDETTKDAFFADDDYNAIREKYYAPAVTSATILASYQIDKT